MSARAGLFVAVIGAASLAACGAAPIRPDGSDSAASAEGRAEVFDDCAPEPGKPRPGPPKHELHGVAAKARCEREVYTIMGGVAHHLGVKCAHCHDESDYSKMTHNKAVANWMATQLIPHVKKRKGTGAVWCNDCHVVDGQGTAKILKAPRDDRWAAEWMTTHLVEDFDTAKGNPLRCKSCHGGNVGTPEFRTQIILTDHLPAD